MACKRLKPILQGVSFIVVPISAGLSHRRLASAATFRDSWTAQDTGERQCHKNER